MRATKSGAGWLLKEVKPTGKRIIDSTLFYEELACSKGIAMFHVSVASKKLSVPFDTAKNRQMGVPFSNKIKGRSKFPIVRILPSSQRTWRE